jgi:hypothetical protein
LLALLVVVAPLITPFLMDLFGGHFVDLVLNIDLPWWALAVIIVLALVALSVIPLLTTKLKRLLALTAAESRLIDPRRPFLLLRSFSDDVTPLSRPLGIGSTMDGAIIIRSSRRSRKL